MHACSTNYEEKKKYLCFTLKQDVLKIILKHFPRIKICVPII